MHVISRKRLREFWGEYHDARDPLVRCFKLAEKAEWDSFSEMKADCPSADLVNHFTAIDIGGNKYRLILEICYADQVVLVRHVLTHADYDKGKWKRLRVGLNPRSFVMKTRPKNRQKPGGKVTTATLAPGSHHYLELVRENPLVVIRFENEYDRAIALLDRLSDRGVSRTRDETEYLLALTVFVEKYEQEHHRLPSASGVEMLRYLIETHQKSQSDVAAGTGLADSTVSEILAGKRKLSVKHVAALARFFKVKAAIFLDE